MKHRKAIRSHYAQDFSNIFENIHHIPQQSLQTSSKNTEPYPFNQHEILKRFLPSDNDFSMNWLELESGKEMAFARDINKTTLLIVGEGEVHLKGPQTCVASSGDTLVIPPICDYILTNNSKNLTKILKMSFEKNMDEELIPYSERLTLKDILAYNQERLKAHVEKPFFKLLEDGTLENPHKLEKFLGCLHVWSHYFQRVMLSRQATCGDQLFHDVFLEHLQEEFGHDMLLKDYAVDIQDPILQATSSWFVYKMFLLDNIGKTAIVHLVLEMSGDEFHSRAEPVLGPHVDSNYFHLHAQADEGHAELGIELLKNQSFVTYSTIRDLIENAWDMFEALMDRIVYLVNEDDALYGK